MTPTDPRSSRGSDVASQADRAAVRRIATSERCRRPQSRRAGGPAITRVGRASIATSRTQLGRRRRRRIERAQFGACDPDNGAAIATRAAILGELRQPLALVGGRHATFDIAAANDDGIELRAQPNQVGGTACFGRGRADALAQGLLPLMQLGDVGAAFGPQQVGDVARRSIDRHGNRGCRGCCPKNRGDPFARNPWHRRMRSPAPRRDACLRACPSSTR